MGIKKIVISLKKKYKYFIDSDGNIPEGAHRSSGGH